MIPEYIQISNDSVIFTNFCGKINLIYWHEKVSWQYFSIPYIGKIITIFCFNNFNFRYLILPPKEIIENINEIKSFIDRVDGSGELLNCLKMMYCGMSNSKQ
jgi:hypothetical protein